MSQHNQHVQQRNPLQHQRYQPTPEYLSMTQSFINGVNDVLDQATTQNQNDTLSTLFDAYQYNNPQMLTTLPEEKV
ncbi:1566_t:CDS:2 [Ambispora leptoticha]|uniref:1566_t:CDS:1 n=1 Tax=Ambispora leptoticha TaxID=144679 RepID=A0A9N8WJR7_9GLOM|nr:1566_t:CDS:2 [Ambispora leptoticha]